MCNPRSPLQIFYLKHSSPGPYSYIISRRNWKLRKTVPLTTKPENVTNFKDCGRLQIQFCASLRKL